MIFFEADEVPLLTGLSARPDFSPIRRDFETFSENVRDARL